jgi:hypothetical protein
MISGPMPAASPIVIAMGRPPTYALAIGLLSAFVPARPA